MPARCGSPLTPFSSDSEPHGWYPFHDRVGFETADFLFRKVQMSAGDIDHLMQLWSATLAPYDHMSPFTSHQDMYRTIDAIELMGTLEWKSFNIRYEGPPPPGPRPSWMDTKYEVCYRDPRTIIHNLIANRDFVDEFDYVPYHEYDVDGQHRFQNLMSGDWAWRQAVEYSTIWYYQYLLLTPLLPGCNICQ